MTAAQYQQYKRQIHQDNGITTINSAFVEAQNNQDSNAYMECFTGSAIVHDEGKTHTGKEEICQWIEEANEKYQSSMEPLKYEESGSNGKLTAVVSGTFPGSPIVLQFHLRLKDDLIDSLKVTG